MSSAILVDIVYTAEGAVSLEEKKVSPYSLKFTVGLLCKPTSVYQNRFVSCVFFKTF